MIQTNSPSEEREIARKVEISRMTNFLLFYSFERAAIEANTTTYKFEYVELGAELERRLRRTGFLPPRETMGMTL